MKTLTKLVAAALLSSSSAFAMTNWNMTVGGTSRNLLLYAPSGLPAHPAVILQLHGMNQDAAYQQAQAKWESVADTGKFLVVLPNGIGKSWDLSGTVDINFMSAIIDTLYKKYSIDKGRVYLSGFSMGGMFTYYAMNKMSDKIAAYAPCSGYSMGGTTAAATRPLPIIHIHGTADDVVGYSGVAAAVKAWRTFNNCPATATTTKPYPPEKSSSVTTRDLWGPCVKNGATTEIVLLSNTGKGHWYSMDAASALSSVEIWNFCKKYSLPGSTSLGERASTGIPTAAAVRFEAGRVHVEAQDLRSVRILDLQGRSVASWSGQSSNDATLSMEAASHGLHVAELVTGAGLTHLRFLVP